MLICLYAGTRACTLSVPVSLPLSYSLFHSTLSLSETHSHIEVFEGSRGQLVLVAVNQLQHIPIDIGSPIQRCSVADPYIMLMAEQGQVVMLTLKQSDSYSSGVRLNVIKPPIAQASSTSEILQPYAQMSNKCNTFSSWILRVLQNVIKKYEQSCSSAHECFLMSECILKIYYTMFASTLDSF